MQRFLNELETERKGYFDGPKRELTIELSGEFLARIDNMEATIKRLEAEIAELKQYMLYL